MKYVSKVGYLSADDFKTLPLWLRNNILIRWYDTFGIEDYSLHMLLSRLFWYDVHSPTGYVFDYGKDPADFLSDGDGMGSGTTTPTPSPDR